MATPKRKLCAACREAATHEVFTTPIHLGHPVTGERMVFDKHGHLHCFDCGADWVAHSRNQIKLVE